MFLELLQQQDLLDVTQQIQVELYGSLALTGKGHGTDTAIMLGLLGLRPESVDPDQVQGLIKQLQDSKQLQLLGEHCIGFEPDKQIIFNRRKSLPFHPNGLRMVAHLTSGQTTEQIYYSVGGGFVLTEQQAASGASIPERSEVPHPFLKAKDLMRLCLENDAPISQIVLRAGMENTEFRWIR
jgi:L-serine dehydratase